MNYDAYTTCCGGRPIVCWLTPYRELIPFTPTLRKPRTGKGERERKALDTDHAMQERDGHDLAMALAALCLASHEFEHVGDLGLRGCRDKPDGWIEENDPGFTLEDKRKGHDRHCYIYQRQWSCLDKARSQCSQGRGATNRAFRDSCLRAMKEAMDNTKESYGYHCKMRYHCR